MDVACLNAHLRTFGRGSLGDEEGGAALSSETVGLGKLLVVMCWLCGARGSNHCGRLPPPPPP